MTIRECYDELGLDFDAVLSRLVNEKLCPGGFADRC